MQGKKKVTEVVSLLKRWCKIYKLYPVPVKILVIRENNMTLSLKFIEWLWLLSSVFINYHVNTNVRKDIYWAKRIDPDQTGPKGASWLGSEQFCYTASNFGTLTCSQMDMFKFLEKPRLSWLVCKYLGYLWSSFWSAKCTQHFFQILVRQSLGYTKLTALHNKFLRNVSVAYH